MAKLPKKFCDRVLKSTKYYQSVVASMKERDSSEADTVTAIKDILADIFGFDKFNELTSEQQIRGTFCDLAIKIDGKVQFLVEVKSADTALNDIHLRQAINYGIHHNIEWVILSNAVEWRFYKIKFEKPVSYEKIASFNLLELNPKDADQLETLFLLAREGVVNNAIDDYHQKSLVLNKFTIAEIIKSEDILNSIRREFRKCFPDVKVAAQDISDIIVNEIFKREVIEGDKVKEAQTRVKRAINKIAKKDKIRDSGDIAISNENRVIEVAN